MKKFLVVLVLAGLVLVGCGSQLVTFESPIIPGGPVPQPGNVKLLYGFISLVVQGGLAGVLVYKFLEAPIGVRVRKNVTNFLTEPFGVGEQVVGRVLAILGATSVSLGFYAIGMAFGLYENPGNLASWLNLALYLSSISYPTSQLAHGRMKDRV